MAAEAEAAREARAKVIAAEGIVTRLSTIVEILKILIQNSN